MAYNKKELLEKSLEEIKKGKLIFFDDIIHKIGISTSTFYAKFPKESKEYKKIEAELFKNRIAMKVGLRKKWYEGDAPATQIGLYKLIGTKEEVERLTQNTISGSLEIKSPSKRRQAELDKIIERENNE